MEKKEFEKAEELIWKGYEKEPENPGIFFYHATLLFTSDYVGYQPDSARVVISHAQEVFNEASEEVRSNILKEAISEKRIQSLAKQISDYLYQQTIKNLSIQTIENYQRKYFQSEHDSILLYKRDSILFRTAKTENRDSSYSTFIKNHPNSIFTLTADSLRDGLRYQQLKVNGSLTDYYTFLQKYPLTRWRVDVEEYILKISTAAHDPSHYIRFIRLAGSVDLKKKAADLLYYLSPEDAIVQHPLKDSIHNIFEESQTVYFPTIDGGSFGFQKMDGHLLIPYLYEEVQEEIKCSTSDDDWIFVKEDNDGEIINKSNDIVLKEVEEYMDIGYGLAIVSVRSKNYLYHKSGFKLLKNVIEDARVLKGKWIKVRVDKKWGLYTFLGLPITEAIYDDIDVRGDFWVFEKNGLLGISTEQGILSEIENRDFSLEIKFDDIELVSGEMLIGFREGRECLMDNSLNFLVSWGEYEIHPDPSDEYLRSSEGYHLYNISDSRMAEKTFSYLESNEGWLALKTEVDWMLIPKHENLSPFREYDSIKLVNRYAALLYKETVKKLIFSSGHEIELIDHTVRSFPNYPKFLAISKNGSLGIYNQQGKMVFDGKYEEVSFLNDTLIKVEIRNKQGLFHSKGKVILNPIFDNLDEKDELILTFYEGKIGCYDLKTDILIPANYEARIDKLGDYYATKKKGKYGLIDEVENQILPFQYDEIKAWNDTSFLVRQGSAQSIISLNQGVLMESLEWLQLLFEQSGNRVFKFAKEGKLGLISNKRGLILEPEFTDIINIGNKNEPLFFADQHLSKAGYHVVSYVKKDGESIFSKAYRPEEFDRILCEE